MKQNPSEAFHQVKEGLGGVLSEKAGSTPGKKLAVWEDIVESFELEVITATRVPDEDRLNFWLRHVGPKYMLSFERHVFGWMRILCGDYNGGFWEFYELSNGGFYIAPENKGKMRLVWPGNYFDGEMSPDAAGIVTTLYALNGFAEQAGPYFSDKYIQLYEFMRLHPEAGVIRAAID